jgi:hypothetical protein
MLQKYENLKKKEEKIKKSTLDSTLLLLLQEVDVAAIQTAP